MRVAVLSDIHSNFHALKAVLNDAEGAQVDETYCLGDLVGYGPHPNRVIEEIRKRGIPTVQGNYDEGVGLNLDSCGCAYTTEREKITGDISLEWTRNNTSMENKRFLRELPEEIHKVIGDYKALFVHGSPRRNNEYLYSDRPLTSLLRMLEPLDIDALIFGHTHIPYHRTVAGIDLINVGSVGKPKDGDPRACYAIIDINEEVEVEFRRVDYPKEIVAREIGKAGLPKDFAEAILSGGRHNR
ncbi:MAG: metallophosphoesterase family protein [Candidatus Bathyarchaeia archaeon]